MVWRLTRTRRARSDAPMPRPLRISATRLLTRFFKSNTVVYTGLPRNCRSSEVDLAGEFEDAGIARAGNRTERRASKNSVGIVQRRGVRDVEHFRAKFHIHPLRNAKCLAQHQIGILKSRPANWIARTASDYKLRGGRE